MGKNIAVNNEYDVIVVGGGPAGCAAAISSARAGAKTLLLESTYTLGGMSTNGLVGWCPVDDGEKIVYRSIAHEIIHESRLAVSFLDPNQLGWGVGSFPEVNKIIYDTKVTESGATVLFGSMVCDVDYEDKKVQSITVANKKGLTKYVAKMYIDCTGDADIIEFAGLPYEKSDCLQPSTLCFILTGIDIEKFKENKMRIRSGNRMNWLQQAIANDPEFDLITDSHMCCGRNVGDTVKFNAGHLFDVDGTDPESVTKAMMQGRKIAFQFRDALAKYMPEVFGKAEVAATAPVLGLRESRRIVGEYTLTLDDYLARRTFPDEIGRNSYNVDIHASPKEMEKYGKDYMYKTNYQYDRGESHGIPLRALIPKDTDNILVAGRTIASDHMIMGSIRVMPCCMVTGEAAGLTAAIAIKNGQTTREVDAQEVRKVLFERGAYIK